MRAYNLTPRLNSGVAPVSVPVLFWIAADGVYFVTWRLART